MHFILSNNKQSYVDYKNKILEYRDINREISEQNKNFHEKRIFNNRLKEQDDINRVNNYYNSMAAQNLIDEKNKKFQYRFSLDEQIKNNLDNKLRNENISYNDVFQSKNYLPKINRPKLIEINPYKHRNYFLGNSQLRHNIITNPLSMYKINICKTTQTKGKVIAHLGKILIVIVKYIYDWTLAYIVL